MSEGGDRAHFTAYTLARVLDTSLRLLHPFTPYVTEELWGHLKRTCQEASDSFAPALGWEDALIAAHWPEAQPLEGWEEQKVADFSLVQEIIRSVRNLRTEKKVTPGKRIPATIVAGDRLDLLTGELKPIAALAHLDANQVTLVKDLPEKPQGQASLVVQGIEIYLPLSGLMDNAAEGARMQKELDDLASQIARLETLLGSSFAEKAPPAVVEKERQKLAGYRESAEKLSGQLADLG